MGDDLAGLAAQAAPRRTRRAAAWPDAMHARPRAQSASTEMPFERDRRVAAEHQIGRSTRAVIGPALKPDPGEQRQEEARAARCLAHDRAPVGRAVDPGGPAAHARAPAPSRARRRRPCPCCRPGLPGSVASVPSGAYARRPAAADDAAAVGHLLQRQLAGGGIDQMRDQRRDGLGHGDLQRKAVDRRASRPASPRSAPPRAPAALTTRPARIVAPRGRDAIARAVPLDRRSRAVSRISIAAPARSAAAAMAGVARSGLALPSIAQKPRADGLVATDRARCRADRPRSRITVSTPTDGLDPRLGLDLAHLRLGRATTRPPASFTSRSSPTRSGRSCHSCSEAVRKPQASAHRRAPSLRHRPRIRGTGSAGGSSPHWRPRPARPDLAGLDQRHLGAVLGQIPRGHQPGDPAADDQHIGRRRITRAHARQHGVTRTPDHDQTFSGSYTVTVTPFTEGGAAIDYAAWKRFLDWQLASGVPGIIILGTTGEFLTHHRRRARRLRRGHGQAHRRAHPGAGRHDERLHAQRGALFAAGRGRWAPTG